ncbi:MAG: winged helix-turn-helix domain-containing protein [Anaerolineales bacterium]
MACINPDGTLTPTATLVLTTANHPITVAEISQSSGLPLYQVRSSLRELVANGLLKEENDTYFITEKGKNLLTKVFK